MREDIPTSISDTIYDLSPEGLVELFKFELLDEGSTVIYFTAQEEVTWQNNLYDSLPCTLSSISLSADGEVSRPKMTIANPQGIFSSHVQSGNLDGATLVQIKILKTDLDANLDVKMTSQWRVSKILSLNMRAMILELRTVLDGHLFKVPSRVFIPPEFPHVSLR